MKRLKLIWICLLLFNCGPMYHETLSGYEEDIYWWKNCVQIHVLSAKGGRGSRGRAYVEAQKPNGPCGPKPRP